MKKVITVIIVAVLGLLTACSSTQSKTTAPSIKPNQVFTWDCEYPEYKPKAITITCADGGIYLSEITWSSWSAAGAQGRGTYNVNSCDPDCADGTMLTAPVNIKLTKLATYHGKKYLRYLVYQTTDGSNLPQTGTDLNSWDVMEFAQSMDEG